MAKKHAAVRDFNRAVFDRLARLIAGKCTVEIHGRSFSAVDAEVVDGIAALPAFSSFHQAAFKAFHSNDCLKLKAN